MSAAVFVSTINVFMASVFCACFMIPLRRRQFDSGEGWLAFAFGLVAAHDLLEIVQQFLVRPEPANFIIFILYLGAMTAMVMGLVQRFSVRVSLLALASLVAFGVPIYLMLLELDRHDPVRSLLYPAPFVVVQLVGCLVIWRGGRSRIDRLLLVAFAASAAIFASKPFIADAVGISREVPSYLGSEYGAFSETFEAFFLISTGVLLVVSVASDLLVESTIRAETDTLSGLLNRRGFEERCNRLIAAAAMADKPVVLILADLDHFKSINDGFGHAVGDQVIEAFARVLRDSAKHSDGALVGRLGGEEFGVFLSGNIVDGRIYGEVARKAFSRLHLDNIAPHDAFTASFGVAELQRGEPVPKLIARADAALYEAKRHGRNRVHVAHALSGVPAAAEDQRRAAHGVRVEI